MCCNLFFFFFSSRRRHTRWNCDWSSDVCSSDLHVPRRAGWDCHGLPVEVAVEKELGLTSKRDIEAYGISAFNTRCRESVLRHVDAFAEFTQRMGYWIDLSQAYRTMDPDYIESVWWSLKEIYGQGLLVRDFRISPYCPRCGTPLSNHKINQPDV